MVEINVECEDWQRAVDEFIELTDKRGLLDGVKEIEDRPKMEMDAYPLPVAAQYLSYQKKIIVSQDASTEENSRLAILFHELGHHLHYYEVLGDADEFETEDAWVEHLHEVFEEVDYTGIDIEFVAGAFEDYHAYGIEPSSHERYRALQGPELGERMVSEDLYSNPANDIV